MKFRNPFARKANSEDGGFVSPELAADASPDVLVHVRPDSPRGLNKKMVVTVTCGIGALVIGVMGYSFLRQSTRQNAVKPTEIAKSDTQGGAVPDSLTKNQPTGGVAGMPMPPTPPAGSATAPGSPGTPGVPGLGAPANQPAPGMVLPSNPRGGQPAIVAAGGVPNLQGGGATTAGGGPPPITAAQQARDRDEAKRLQLADQAKTSSMVAYSGTDAGAGLGAGANATNALVSQMQALAKTANPQAQGPQLNQALMQDDPNKQNRKEAFLAQAGKSNQDGDWLKTIPQGQITPYELKAGGVIPGSLITGINSDLPGQISGQVRENVYDTRTGRYLLVPQGTRIVGTYDSQVAFGQNRIGIVWTRLIFPNGESINIGGMPGSDESGYSGATGDVNNHYGKLYGGAIMMSLISTGAQLTQPRTSSTNTVPTPGQTAAGAMGTQLAQVASQQVSKTLNIQPTITIEPGTRFNIQVSKDITFLHPYKA